MALTEHRLRTSTPEAATIEPTTQRPRPSGQLLLGVAWLVLLPTAYLLEPASQETTIPLWGWVVGYAFLAGLGLTAAGLARRTTWAAGASLTTSTVFLGQVFACPATGHHLMGLWWFGELACVLTLFALSATAVLRRAR